MSSEHQDKTVDIKGVVAPDETEIGVPGERALLAFAEAAVRRDEPALEKARETLSAELGVEALVDAAGVVGNFERMNRIADGCGITVDGAMALASYAARRELNIDHFVSAANSEPITGARRLFATVVQPLLPFMLKRLQRAVEKRQRERAARPEQRAPDPARESR